MEITVNGRQESLAQEMALADFLQGKGFKPGQIAVEYNDEIVAGSSWAEIELQAGDNLEIVTFMGGGC